MNKYVSGAIGVEVQLKSGVPRIYLPDVVDLRKKRIKHIDICTSTNIPKTPSGNNLVNLSVANYLFLTLVETNTQKELIRSLPVTELNTMGNRLFINKIVDLQRSYIDLSAVADPSYITNKSIYLVFWYDEPSVWGIINANEKTAIQPFEITLTGLKTYFAENMNLNNKLYQNIILTMPAKTPTGKDGIVSNTNKFITLRKNGLQFFMQVPLYMFYQANLNFPLRLQNIQFDMQNSFIETLTTTSNDLKTVFFNAIIDDNPVYHHNK